MRVCYTDLDIVFSLNGFSIHALNIIFERFTRALPAHSHGSGCYEIHYIPSGRGSLQADGVFYEITPNALFVTGPHVEHAQAPELRDPMEEYCVYLKIIPPSSAHGPEPSGVTEAFCRVPFWFGQDTQGVGGLMRRLFEELSQKSMGYQEQVRLLLSQLIIALARSYDKRRPSPTAFSPKNISDAKSVIIEEYFLYEYQDLSLQELSRRLGLSPRQTQRLLTEYYGKSFQQKKAEARMSAAALLLSDPARSITSIAEALGYSSVEHFSSAFRGYYGVSPRTYRQTRG
ncbi:MAG: AraC family transcriptional regulator [Eubacteriales bacterium]|nr:AraC family transcriptional regulator [Eubacteriales bacterium]